MKDIRILQHHQGTNWKILSPTYTLIEIIAVLVLLEIFAVLAQKKSNFDNRFEYFHYSLGRKRRKE